MDLITIGIITVVTILFFLYLIVTSIWMPQYNIFKGGGKPIFEYLRLLILNLAVLVLALFQLLQAFLKNFGSILGTLAIEFGALLAPAATAIIIWSNVQRHMHLDPLPSFVLAIALESVGIAAGSLLIKVESNNQLAKAKSTEKLRLKHEMPKWYPRGAYGIYFLAVQGIIIGLGALAGSDWKAIFVEFFISLLSVSASIIIGYKDVYKEKFDTDVLDIQDFIQTSPATSPTKRARNTSPATEKKEYNKKDGVLLGIRWKKFKTLHEFDEFIDWIGRDGNIPNKEVYTEEDARQALDKLQELGYNVSTKTMRETFIPLAKEEFYGGSY